MPENNFPKLHNATWPGIVGKGPDSEPPIDFDKMLKMTAAAEVDGVKFDGVDLGLFDPHINIDLTDDGIKKLADKVGASESEDWKPCRSHLGWTCNGYQRRTQTIC